ncbi:jg7662 [Pararge aegeria aegeria]|uniref:Jg7662 protein n=1 Tax=Pararge aegeria aegeria TaxID=348720 RepID=A0A8S4SKF4_9NEOP|nr:jg7662 [Pararge aegeria aegeria]
MGGAHSSENRWTLGFQGVGMATPHRACGVSDLGKQRWFHEDNLLVTVRVHVTRERKKYRESGVVRQSRMAQCALTVPYLSDRIEGESPSAVNAISDSVIR